MKTKSSDHINSDSERIRILLDDGYERDHPDISFEMWEELVYEKNPEIFLHVGDSEYCYGRYLKSKNMVNLSDFNSQTTNEITLVMEQKYRGRVLKFRCVYDSDNEKDFNEKEYFKE